MKFLLVIAIIVVGVILYLNLRSTETNSVSGKIGDINDHFKKLMLLEEGEGFLAVTVSDTGDFVQFTGDKTGVQLDLPQITDRQKDLNTKFNSIAKEMGLIVIKNEGSDGSEFLDINIHGDVTKVTDIASDFIRKLYNVEETTEIIFTTN